MTSRGRLLQRPDIVPYITSWSDERILGTPIVPARDGLGIAYVDEIPHDRDDHGVLWARSAVSYGVGRADYGAVHPLRQRRAMRRLLCQVCGGPPDRNEQGVLWLLGTEQDTPLGWPENQVTAFPPLCLPCAKTAIAYCPHLAAGWAAVRVAASFVDGVYGRLYRPGAPLPLPGEKDVRLYQNDDVRWILAAQLVRTLRGCTMVDLDMEIKDVTPRSKKVA